MRRPDCGAVKSRCAIKNDAVERNIPTKRKQVRVVSWVQQHIVVGDGAGVEDVSIALGIGRFEAATANSDATRDLGACAVFDKTVCKSNRHGEIVAIGSQHAPTRGRRDTDQAAAVVHNLRFAPDFDRPQRPDDIATVFDTGDRGAIKGRIGAKNGHIFYR